MEDVRPIRFIAWFVSRSHRDSSSRPSISKNWHEPYARHFGPVNVPIKAKMIEVLATQWASAPDGGGLLGAVLQLTVEQEVFQQLQPN